MGAKKRNFPRHKLEEALRVPQKIQDEMAGRPFRRLLLAEALGMGPSSIEFRDLLSSSYKYGLTEGTEKAAEISLTPIGKKAIQSLNAAERLAARRQAVLTPPVFQKFFKDYADKKLPSSEMMTKILIAEYGVPQEHAQECAELILANGRFCYLIRDIGGSPHVLLYAGPPEAVPTRKDEPGEEPEEAVGEAETTGLTQLSVTVVPEQHLAPREAERPRPIFIGHGKNKVP